MESVFKTQSEADLSKWAKSFFYDKLTAQGFVSYQDKGLSWYKVVDNTILQTVYLFSDSYMMLMPVLGFGCHPLFINAPLPHKLHESVTPYEEVIRRVKRFETPKVMFADCPVMYPKTPEGGAELLDSIVFPHFAGLKTEGDAYRVHRDSVKRRLDEFLSRKSWEEYNGWAVEKDFVDEVIYMDDQEMLEYCKHDLELSLYWREKDRKRIEEQRAAVYDGKRDEFIAMLEKRKRRFVKRLGKNVGIHVDL
ncbi:MAG: hypothetical protein IJA49_06620 [Oscillospiraceae bacterium]|nr:hypothetical protein [Oscillospiraceae bacterium]